MLGTTFISADADRDRVAKRRGICALLSIAAANIGSPTTHITPRNLPVFLQEYRSHPQVQAVLRGGQVWPITWATHLEGSGDKLSRTALGSHQYAHIQTETVTEPTIACHSHQVMTKSRLMRAVQHNLIPLAAATAVGEPLSMTVVWPKEPAKKKKRKTQDHDDIEEEIGDDLSALEAGDDLELAASGDYDLNDGFVEGDPDSSEDDFTAPRTT